MHSHWHLQKKELCSVEEWQSAVYTVYIFLNDLLLSSCTDVVLLTIIWETKFKQLHLFPFRVSLSLSLFFLLLHNQKWFCVLGRRVSFSHGLSQSIHQCKSGAVTWLCDILWTALRLYVQAEFVRTCRQKRWGHGLTRNARRFQLLPVSVRGLRALALLKTLSRSKSTQGQCGLEARVCSRVWKSIQQQDSCRSASGTFQWHTVHTLLFKTKMNVLSNFR